MPMRLTSLPAPRRADVGILVHQGSSGVPGDMTRVAKPVYACPTRVQVTHIFGRASPPKRM